MSYCRFHNTLSDLQDCENALRYNRDELQDTERRKAIQLVELCKEIAEMFPEGLEAYLEDEESEDEDEESSPKMPDNVMMDDALLQSLRQNVLDFETEWHRIHQPT